LTRRSPIWYLLASLAAYFALWNAIPRARFLVSASDWVDACLRGAHQPLATILLILGVIILSIPTIAFMAAQVSIIYYFARLRLRFVGGLLWLVGCLAGSAVVVAVMVWRSGIVTKLHRLPSLREIGLVMGIYSGGPLGMVVYTLILLAAASIGCMVSLRVKDKNLLLPVVMFAATIDFWTVTAGPVSSMMQHAPELLKAVSAPIPKAGTGAFVPALAMGPGDPLFIALVFAAVHRLGLNARRNFAFVLALMTAGMLAVMMNLVPYLPALVVLAIAVIAANRREFKLTRQEKISTAIVAVVLVATIPVVWHLLKPLETPKRKPAPPIAAPRSRS